MRIPKMSDSLTSILRTTFQQISRFYTYPMLSSNKLNYVKLAPISKKGLLTPFNMTLMGSVAWLMSKVTNPEGKPKTLLEDITYF